MSAPVTTRVLPWAFKVKGHGLVFKRWERKAMEQAGSKSKISSLHMNCPVTERKVTAGEKDLMLASVPQILSDFYASLVLS